MNPSDLSAQQSTDAKDRTDSTSTGLMVSNPNPQAKRKAQEVKSWPHPLQDASLKIEVDTTKSTFDHIEADLKKRIQDARVEPKPEIVADLDTCRVSLAEAEKAYTEGSASSVRLRLAQAKQSLSRLQTYDQ